MRWALAVLAVFWMAGAGAQELGSGQITVTGEGRVDAAPDMATITVGVSAEARSAGEALDQTSRATAAVLAQLTDAGIAGRDMQTRDLSLQPLWESRNSSSGKEPRIYGYTASNTVVVRVRDLPKLGEILDNVVESGANQFHGLSFGLQEPGPVMDQARKAAVAEAMRKAALYADAAGLQLGAVLQMSESGSSPRPIQLERMAAMSEAVPIAQGEVTISASVNMVFALQGQ